MEEQEKEAQEEEGLEKWKGGEPRREDEGEEAMRQPAIREEDSYLSLGNCKTL